MTGLERPPPVKESLFYYSWALHIAGFVLSYVYIRSDSFIVWYCAGVFLSVGYVIKYINVIVLLFSSPNTIKRQPNCKHYFSGVHARIWRLLCRVDLWASYARSNFNLTIRTCIQDGFDKGHHRSFVLCV